MKSAKVTSYGDPLPRKRSAWFTTIMSTIEAEQKQRLCREHAAIIAAVAMGLPRLDLTTIVGASYFIGDQDVTETVQKLMNHGILGLSSRGVVVSLLD